MSQQINLFNPIFLKQKAYFSASMMQQALGLILFGGICVSIYMNYQVSNLSKIAAATSVQLGEAQARLVKVTATHGPRQKSKSLEDDIQKEESNTQSLQRVLDILHQGEFGNTKGYAEYLRAFSRQILDGVWLTGFRIHGAGSEIDIQGRALQPETVPLYITNLKREPVLQGKSFATLEMQIPAVDNGAKHDLAAGKPHKQPAYIEFNLRSSDTLKESPELAGAKPK